MNRSTTKGRDECTTLSPARRKGSTSTANTLTPSHHRDTRENYTTQRSLHRPSQESRRASTKHSPTYSPFYSVRSHYAGWNYSPQRAPYGPIPVYHCASSYTKTSCPHSIHPSASARHSSKGGPYTILQDSRYPRATLCGARDLQPPSVIHSGAHDDLSGSQSCCRLAGRGMPGEGSTTTKVTYKQRKKGKKTGRQQLHHLGRGIASPFSPSLQNVRDTTAVRGPVNLPR